ncbi:MAG: hypothetical protein LBS45_03710 [Synergistaceae bacterium]|nr:hypothetical protein [Synergistaceae bacterium]
MRGNAIGHNLFNGTTRLPYWDRNMDFDIETWVPYGCDFKPITINSLFSDALGKIAEMALRLESEFLYMDAGGGCPVGTLVPENLIRPRMGNSGRSSFAMVFSYSRGMEDVLFDLVREGAYFGAGITLCGIWRSSILVAEFKVLVVASESPLFDPDVFLDALCLALCAPKMPLCGDNVPYYAEKFGYRRVAIPYETDDMTQLQISHLLSCFEFDETRRFVGPIPELSMDNLL